MNDTIKQMLAWQINHVESTYQTLGSNPNQFIQRVPGGWIYWNEYNSYSSSDGLSVTLSSGVFVPEPRKE